MPSEHPDLPDARAPSWAAWLEVAMAACDEADAIALAHFRQDLHIEAKPDRTFVTAGGHRRSSGRSGRASADAFPDHGLVGEEYGERPSASGRRWIIDPIDGTHNFMRGVPLFGTLLGARGRRATWCWACCRAPALGTALVRVARRRRLGAPTWSRRLADRSAARRHARLGRRPTWGGLGCSTRRVPQLIDSGLVPGFTRLIREVWRDRGLRRLLGVRARRRRPGGGAWSRSAQELGPGRAGRARRRRPAAA